MPLILKDIKYFKDIEYFLCKQDLEGPVYKATISLGKNTDTIYIHDIQKALEINHDENRDLNETFAHSMFKKDDTYLFSSLTQSDTTVKAYLIKHEEKTNSTTTLFNKSGDLGNVIFPANITTSVDDDYAVFQTSDGKGLFFSLKSCSEHKFQININPNEIIISQKALKGGLATAFVEDKSTGKKSTIIIHSDGSSQVVSESNSWKSSAIGSVEQKKGGETVKSGICAAKDKHNSQFILEKFETNPLTGRWITSDKQKISLCDSDGTDDILNTKITKEESVGVFYLTMSVIKKNDSETFPTYEFKVDINNNTASQESLEELSKQDVDKLYTRSMNCRTRELGMGSSTSLVTHSTTMPSFASTSSSQGIATPTFPQITSSYAPEAGGQPNNALGITLVALGVVGVVSIIIFLLVKKIIPFFSKKAKRERANPEDSYELGRVGSNGVGGEHSSPSATNICFDNAEGDNIELDNILFQSPPITTPLHSTTRAK